MMTVRALCVVLVAIGVVGMASADLATTTSDPSAPQQIHIAFRGAVRGVLMRFSSAWCGCVLPCVTVCVYHGYVVDVLCDGGACVPATALLCPWIYSCCWCATFQNYDMVVSWLTGVQTSTSTVKYGTSSGVYTHTVNGSLATSYYKDNFVHHVVLEGLTASTTYYYVCGDAAVRSSCRGYTIEVSIARSYHHSPFVNQQGGFSSEFAFMTPPTTDQRAFKVMVYGDMGITNSGSNLQQILAHKDDVDWGTFKWDGWWCAAGACVPVR